jgi:hypothetical protein
MASRVIGLGSIISRQPPLTGAPTERFTGAEQLTAVAWQVKASLGQACPVHG